MSFKYEIEAFQDFLNKFIHYQNFIEEKLLEEWTETFSKVEKIFEKELPNRIILVDDKIDESNLQYQIQRQQLYERFRRETGFYTSSFRASLLVQLFSVFEHKLIDLCNEYYKEFETDFKVKDLKGSSDIDKAKMYLSKSCKVDFSNINEEWNFISIIRKLRNKIIHNQSSISKNDADWKAIKTFIDANNNKISLVNSIKFLTSEEIDFMSTNEQLELYINNENLSLEFIEIIQIFFEKLLIQINKK